MFAFHLLVHAAPVEVQSLRLKSEVLTDCHFDTGLSMQNSDELHLRAELRGHEEDVSDETLLVMSLMISPCCCQYLRRPWLQVRAVITCPLGLVTASRDKSVRVWTEGEDHQFSLDKSLVIASAASAFAHNPD